MEQGRKTEAEVKRAGRGCLFYGALGAGVVFLLLILAAYLGLRYAKNLVTQYTDERPAPLPQVQMSQADFQRLQRRVDNFRENLREEKNTTPLTLTADEVNALIANDPDLAPLRDKILVTFNAAQLEAQVSVPLDDLGLPKLRGRYLNANGKFAVIFRDGVLRVFPQSLEVKGKPLPEVYMKRLRKHNLVDRLNSDPRATAALETLDEIQIKDGKLVLVPKPPKGSAPTK